MASKYQITCSPGYRTVPSVTQNYWKFLNTTKSRLHSHLHIPFLAFYLPFFLYELPANVTSHSSLFGQVPVLFWDRSHLEQSLGPCVKPVLQRSLSQGNKYSVVQRWCNPCRTPGARRARKGTEPAFRRSLVMPIQGHWTSVKPHSFPQWVSTGWSFKLKSHFHKLMLLRPHVLILTPPKT